MLVFTFFDLVGDILRNRIPLITVGDYLFNLTPYLLYSIAPLAVLIAALVTFAVLNRNSEIIAMKATGISLYRLVIPIVSIAADSGGLPVSLRPVLSAPGQPQAGGAAQHHQGPAAADRAASGAQLDLRPAAPRRTGPHLLLRVLRSRPQRVRQSLGLRVRSSTFSLTRRIFAARVYWDPETELLALPERLGARHERRGHHRLPRVQTDNFLRNS